MATEWSQEAGMTGETPTDNVKELADVAQDNADASAVSATESEASATASAASASSSSASASQASTSAANSATSASQSATSATASANSASAANTSASNASTSATNAANSASAASTSATNAAASESTVEGHANDAATSEANAATSETNAATSETNAATSASTALTQATNSANSATASATSATNSANSATAAANSASAASTSESNALTSETNAAVSEANAATSASSASTSATTATTQAGIATTQATNSANSATASSNSATASQTSAANSASSASASATSASTAASEASIATSERVAAETAELAASGHEVAAQGYATDALNYRNDASTASSDAQTSASNAATSASNALTSANNSAASATTSVNAKTASEAARDATLAALDSFDDRYLGQKSSEPALDNDGDALVSGALFFNSTSNSMMVYDGSTWLPAYASLSGALLSINNLNDLANLTTSLTNLGLNNVDNTSDLDKPVSTATQSALDGKVDDSQVLTNVPAGAVFTDTVYSHPSTHPATMITTTDEFAYSNSANVQDVLDDLDQAIANVNAKDPVITLTGDVTGSGTMTNLGNVSITATVADDSHNHTIANVDGLQTALDGKLSTSGKAADSNLLDGLDSSQFLRSDTNNVFTGTELNILNALQWKVSSSDNAVQQADARDDATNFSRLYWYGKSSSGSTSNFRHAWYDGSAYVNIDVSGGGIDFTGSASHMTIGGSTVWHSGNDGSGSGLDADLLDGLHESTFMRKSADSGLDMNSYNITDVEDIYLQDRIYHDGDTDTYIQFHAANQWRVVTGGTERLEVNDTNVTISNTLVESSDARLKENVRPITNALSKVTSLQGVHYNKIESPDNEEIGFIAQEVEEVVPEIVTTDNTEEGMKAVSYARTVALLVEAMKEQQAQIEDLKLKLEHTTIDA